MAKETMIVFVYDTECLKDEADDPVSAVLYFHPSWVSDTQKVALCGQLMGTSYFLKDCFFKPRIISLQNGKFVLKEFGRFLLAVGTDRNISDYLLQHRADLLASLVRFYHRDLQTIFDQGQGSKNLSDKLYHIFETYLPILQNSGNIFQNVPKLRMPKTGSNIFLDAIQTLQCCQQTKGVLGGAILYHNKVVASQLSDAITKQLVITDPLHIRSTAEQITATDYDLQHIPNGVQMLIVYVDLLEYRKLSADAQRAQSIQTTQLSQGGGMHFTQYAAKRKMKRDKSLIFTHIPEEGTTSAPAAPDSQTEESKAPMRPKSLMTRPTHLPLRLKNSLNSKELPESGIASINFDETDSYPEFIGRTSVCSTPMTENKVLNVANIMSICANPDDDESNSNSEGKILSEAQKQNGRSAGTPSGRRNSLKMDFERFFQNFITNPNKQLERRNSLTDLQDSLKKISKKLALKAFRPPDVNRNNGGDPGSPDFIENDDEENSDNSDENNKTSRTITDPTYPMFNANGQPISRSLFQEFLEKYYKLWGDSNGGGGEESRNEAEIAELIEEFKEFDNELKKLDESLRQDSNNRNLNVDEVPPLPQLSKPKTPMDKKSMSLPLKPLTENSSSGGGDAPMAGFGGGRKQPGGIPLTPLMAKLSVLALNDERPTWDATPGGSAIEIQTPLTTVSKVFPRRSSLKCEDAVDALAVNMPATTTATSSLKDGLQRVELYLCGQQNMTLLLLMEEGTGRQQQTVQKMFEICVAKFPHMESHLNQTLNINVEGDKREGGYSFICLDSKWDALQRCGPWNPVELNTLECMHRDLQCDENVNVTDLVLRSHDTVFYGYSSGRREFFYKEPVHQMSGGIPPPSDPMGNISMRAKTRLDRDHSYILF